MAEAGRRARTDPTVVAILDAAPATVIGFGEDLLIDYVGPRTVHDFGYEPDELLGRSIDVLMHPDEMPAHHANLAAYFADATPRGRGGAQVFHGLRKDGSTFPVDIGLTPSRTPDGLWTIATIVDVTEQLATQEALRLLNRAYLTLARFNEAIVRAGSAEELYAAMCAVAVEQGGYLGAWVGRRGPGGLVAVATAGSLDDYIERLEISLDPDSPRGQGPTGRAMRTGEPQYSSDYVHDATTQPWHELGAAHGIAASATIPLRAGGRVVSALTLYSDRAHLFDAGMRDLLEGMAHNISFALDAFADRERLERVAAQRSDLLRRLVLAQEEERARIAADVHDDSVQALAAVDLRLGLLRRKVHEAAPDLEDGVVRLQDAVSEVTAGLRHLLFDLEPVASGVDLAELLRDAADHTFAPQSVTWSVDVAPGGSLDLADEMVTTALRIGQEALINVRKHARAREVRVLLTPDDAGVGVAVSDDGVGLPEAPGAGPGHRGMATMVDRAEAAGGWCRVASGPDGTTVHYWVPRQAPPLVVS
ncbi:MAG: GAF domain-containing protein [Nocardioides sp.]